MKGSIERVCAAHGGYAGCFPISFGRRFTDGAAKMKKEQDANATAEPSAPVGDVTQLPPEAFAAFSSSLKAPGKIVPGLRRAAKVSRQLLKDAKD